MSLDGFDRILKRSLKYSVAPYLLTTEDYWGYIYVEQQHHKAWAFKFLLIDVVVFLGLLMLLLTYHVNYFWIGFLCLLFITSALLNGIYATSSKSARRWWISLTMVALFLFLLSIWLITINEAGIILSYLSVSHLIALIRARRKIKS